jgi:hypothetical protein
MKHSRLIFGAISIGFQVITAALLLWAANDSSLTTVHTGDLPGGAARQLIAEYRSLLSIARKIFIDAGIGLICSATLSVTSLCSRS